MMKHLLKAKAARVYPFLNDRFVEMCLGGVDDASEVYGEGWMLVWISFYYKYRRRPFLTATCYFTFSGNRTDNFRFSVQDEKTIKLLSGGV